MDISYNGCSRQVSQCYTLTIYDIQFTTGYTVPLPAVIVSLAVDEHNYKLDRFPPSACSTDGDMWFYSSTLIIDVLLCTGVNLLIIITWALHKV